MRVKLWILSLLVGGSLSAQDWVQGMQDHSVNFYTVQQQFNNYWKDREQGKGKGYKQFKRWEWFMEQRVAPDGDRPDPAILYNTLQESYKTNSTQDMGTWTAMGPFDAPQDGFNGIGRINGLEFHPTQPDTMWAGSPSGGLWITYDNGQNWFTPTDDLPNIGVSDIAVDPQRPHILYMATGDRDGGDTYSYGVLKSTDGGLTWGTTGFSWNVSQQRRIGRLIVHPNDTNVVVVASRNGIYRSTDEGATFSLVQAGGFNTIIASPAAPDTMFAGTISNSSARVYRSIDGGANWTLLNSHGLPSSGGTRRVELAISHQDPDYVYALYSDANQEFYGLYQTTNGGDNWSLKSSSPNILGSAASGNGSGGQSWYDLCLSVSTVNKNQVFVGGINLWRSNNAGQNWTYIGGYSFPRVHPDMHYMKFKPGTNTMYVGHDGGITYTSTAGASWVHLVDGFNITQYYKMSTSQQSPDVVIGGSQDNSTHVLKNGVWDTPFGGDGMDCEINPLNDQYMYGSSQYGNFRRSSNGGASFNYIGGGLPNGSGGWVTPIELDPVTPSTVYIGYSRLWKSTNNGISWTATGTQSFGQIDEIAIAPSNTSVIYISINSSIYRSVNGGQNWSNITSGIATQRNITDIAISSTNENHIWVTKSGYDNGVKVFESIDGGQNWSNVSGTLPNLPANTIEYAPGTSDGIYVGTDVGVYYKDNNLSDWISFSQGLPNVIVIDLEIYHAGKKLRTATYGRGIWESDLYSELVGAPEVAFIANPSTICSLNDTITLNDLSTNFPTSFNWTITPSTFQYVNGTSATSQNPQVVFTANANYTVTLTASNVFGSDTKTEVNAIGVGGYQLPFLEEFEGDYAFEKWSVNNPDGDKTWTLKTANAGSPGGGVAKMRFYNVSGIGNQDELISPAINLATVSSATMTFDYAYKYYNSSRIDTLEVYISTDCGATWTMLSSYTDDGTGNFATGSGNGSQTTDFMPAMASDWCGTTPTCKSISLDSYVGSTGALIKFVGINGNGNNLYLDNINITGVSNVQPTSDFISDTVACMNNTIQFMDISQNYPTSWEWTFTGGTPATSSIQNPNVSYSVAGTYPVKLKVTNSIGSDSIVKTSYVTIEPTKNVSISIVADNAAICQGDTVTYTATAVNPGSFPTYQWVYNGNNVGGNSPTLTLTNINAMDSVRCILTSSEECASTLSASSNTVMVAVNPLPNVTLAGIASVCSTDSAFALSGGSPAGGVYSGNGVTNGMFDPSEAGNGSHWITYTYTDINGCESSDKKSVYVYNQPSKPTISVSNSTTLICNQLFSTFQWMDGNGNDIPGATSQTFSPSANGTYSVRIQDGNGCTNVSDPFTIGNISVEEYLQNSLNIFPNPTSGNVNVNLASPINAEGKVTITNTVGAIVYSESVNIEKGENKLNVDLSNFANGMYILQIEIEQTSIQQQIVKM